MSETREALVSNLLTKHTDHQGVVDNQSAMYELYDILATENQCTCMPEVTKPQVIEKEVIKHPFLTELFYEDSYWGLGVLNTLLVSGEVTTNDHYQSGEFLTLEVRDCEKTREILSKVISDIDAYKVFNAEGYLVQNEEDIALSTLHELHRKAFPGWANEIMYDHEHNYFNFAGAED
jgi:hypothetical protein